MHYANEPLEPLIGGGFSVPQKSSRYTEGIMEHEIVGRGSTLLHLQTRF